MLLVQFFQGFDVWARILDADPGRAPADGVGNDPQDVGVAVDGQGLVTGPEVEDLAVAALEGATGTENLAALEPRDEDQFVGIGDAEGLAVHLGVRQLKILANAFGDRVTGVDVPQAFFLALLAPFQAAGGAEQATQNLRVVTGMQHDQPHALLDALLHAVHDRILDGLMRHVPPPGHRIGLAQHLFGQPVLGLVKRGDARRDAVRLGSVCPLEDTATFVQGATGCPPTLSAPQF